MCNNFPEFYYFIQSRALNQVAYMFAQQFWSLDCSDAPETKLSILLINSSGRRMEYSTHICIYTLPYIHTTIYVYEANADAMSSIFI